MNWEMVGALGETVGAAAVVVSLLYVAHQVRTASVEAKAQRRERLTAELNRMFELLAGDQELSKLYLAGLGAFEPLAPHDQVRFSALMTHLFSSLESAYHAQESKDWPEWSAQDYRAVVAEFACYAGVRQWWSMRRQTFSPGFVAHVDRLVAEPSSEMSGWIGSGGGSSTED